MNELQPFILLQSPGHLLWRHVHSVDARGAMLQQAVREASGGRADIKAYPSCRLDQKILERTFELKSGTAGIAGLCGDDFDTRTSSDTLARLIAPLPIHAHFARQQHGLSFLARFGKSTLDKQHVHSLLAGFFLPGFVRGLCRGGSHCSRKRGTAAESLRAPQNEKLSQFPQIRGASSVDTEFRNSARRQLLGKLMRFRQTE